MKEAFFPIAGPSQGDQLMSRERRDGLRRELLHITETELTRIDQAVISLLHARHQLFGVEGIEYVQELYDSHRLRKDPAYARFVADNLGTRKKGVNEYHDTTENYDVADSEERAVRNNLFGYATMLAGQETGFIAREPRPAADPIGRKLGILDSELKPITEEVAAVVVTGAAGMSSLKRAWDAFRNIEDGRTNTNRIILAAGVRPVGDEEKKRIAAPFHAGDTEFELMKSAAQDLLGVTFRGGPEEFAVPYGRQRARLESTTARIGGRDILVEVIEAPFDANRKLDDGSPAKRTNTRETLLATLPLLRGRSAGPIVIVSHDTWVPWQGAIGREVYTLGQGRKVYATGPFNQDRFITTEIDRREVLSIRGAQDVVDEIVKTQNQLVRTRIALS